MDNFKDFGDLIKKHKVDGHLVVFYNDELKPKNLRNWMQISDHVAHCCWYKNDDGYVFLPDTEYFPYKKFTKDKITEKLEKGPWIQSDLELGDFKDVLKPAKEIKAFKEYVNHIEAKRPKKPAKK